MSESALAGRSVVVTREADRAAALVHALTAAGAIPITIPALRTAAPLDGGRSLARAVATIDRFDWALFTSAAAARAAASVPGGWPDRASVRVGVVGAATAAAADGAGMAVSVTAPVDDASASGLARAVLSIEPDPCTALVPSSDIARPDLPDALRSARWRVEVVEAYRTIVLPVGDADAERASVADAIVFLSPSAVDAWAGRPLPGVVVTIGPASSAAVGARGATVSAEAAERSVDGVVAALTAAFSA